MKTALYIIVVCLLSTVFNPAQGQLSTDDELHLLLKEKDSVLFNAAFDTCDAETMESLFTEDFEFYHDKGGVTIGRESFLIPIRTNCSTLDPKSPQPSKRILLENSLRVYPLRKDGELYGAIQEGIHRFEFLNEKQQYQKGDIAKFTHIWMLTDGQWKIKRELSFDHQAAETY
ncbi:MAG: nuclear transport factor 2 family protein [Eudoraea sp.]|nr:nuclear transport factor 2 family protein [Eudoraea sp.]